MVNIICICIKNLFLIILFVEFSTYTLNSRHTCIHTCTSIFFSNHIQNFHYTCSISFQNTSGCMIQSLFTILSVFITNNDVIIIFKMSWQFHNKAKYLASPANAFTLHKNQQSQSWGGSTSICNNNDPPPPKNYDICGL